MVHLSLTLFCTDYLYPTFARTVSKQTNKDGKTEAIIDEY